MDGQDSGSVELTFSAPAEAWLIVADHWYGERISSLVPEAYKDAEKLIADIDDAVRDAVTVAPVPGQEYGDR